MRCEAQPPLDLRSCVSLLVLADKYDAQDACRQLNESLTSLIDGTTRINPDTREIIYGLPRDSTVDVRAAIESHCCSTLNSLENDAPFRSMLERTPTLASVLLWKSKTSRR